MDWSKRVFEHGRWRILADGVWEITGRLPNGPMPRNMIAARLPSGGLILHSVICLNESAMSELESFGPPEVLIVPNPLHRLDAHAYTVRYPQVRVICPQSIVDKVTTRVQVDETVERAAESYGFQFHRILGLKSTERAYEFGPTGSRVLVFCDALMNMPHYPGTIGLTMRLIGSTGFFGISRIGRWFLMKNRQQFREWLLEQAKRTDLRAISVAHGATIDTEIGPRLREAAERLGQI